MPQHIPLPFQRLLSFSDGTIAIIISRVKIKTKI